MAGKKQPRSPAVLMAQALERLPAGEEFTARRLVVDVRDKRGHRATLARRAHETINEAIARGEVLRLREGTFGDPRDKAVYIKL